MGSFTAKENKILMPLVADCVNYGFNEKEALKYIETRLGRKISTDACYRRKKMVDTGDYAQQWLNYFTRVGFVVKHQEILDTIQMIYQDTIKDYIEELKKDPESRSETRINRLRYEIRENSKLLQELSLGTPIVAQIKAKIERLERSASTESTAAAEQQPIKDNVQSIPTSQ